VSTGTVITPTARRAFTRSLFWIVAAVFILVIAVLGLGVVGSANSGIPLDPENPGPTGAMALAEVLRQQGVDVKVTSSLADTEDAIGSPESTTLVVHDTVGYLTDEQVARAVGLTGHVILIDPGFRELREVAPDVAQAGVVSGTLEADCDVAAVRKAGSVSGAASGFRVTGDESGVITCLGSGDGVYSLVELSTDAGRLTLLGTTGALSNEQIIQDGNAALALNLLGETDELVWYLPSFADLEETGPETIGELTPPWVTPVLVLLVVTFIAAAIWRGRRFGPLIVENLPVTVRASETMLGRARLYEKSTSRLRALDSLRIGSVQRLAALAGLPRTATVDDVIASVASITGAQPGDIRRLLVEAEPTTDRDLIALSDALLTLERDVGRAVRP
jgi:hypothetical protein